MKEKPVVTIHIEADIIRVESSEPITVHKVIGGVLVETMEVSGET